MKNIVLRLKENMISQLTSNVQNMNDPYIVVGNKSYTRLELSEELKNETDFGIKLMSDMVLLALDLTSRKKEPK